MGDISQYVISRIEHELFGLNIRFVQEIIKRPEMKKISSKIPYFLGVIDQRNQSIPLINVRKKFYNSNELSPDPVVIIVQDARLNKLIGLVVDEVQSVVSIPNESIDHPIIFSGRDGEESVSGVAKLNAGLVIILNDEKLFSEIDYKTFEKIIK